MKTEGESKINLKKKFDKENSYNTKNAIKSYKTLNYFKDNYWNISQKGKPF